MPRTKKYILKVKIYQYGKEPKCEGCNWNTCTIAELVDPKDNLKVSGKLCGNCMVETLANLKAIITLK